MSPNPLEVNDPSELYPEHLAELRRRTEEALRENSLDGVLIAAGDAHTHHRDDAGHPFRPTSEYARWVSGMYGKDDPSATKTGARLDYTPGHAVFFNPNREKPTLLVQIDPQNPWSFPAEIPGKAESHFDIVRVTTREELWGVLGQPSLYGRRIAYIGPKNDTVNKHEGEKQGLIVEPKEFMAHMDWGRLPKTPYEIACITAANVTAAAGHEAALDAFMQGGSELDIFMAFSQRAKTREAYFPYHGIVAIGPHGATLHYELANDHARNGESVLIDMGTHHNWYISDITCTHVKEKTHTVFKQLVKGLDKIQKELCQRLNKNATFFELQKLTHIRIAELLLEVGILKGCSAEAAVLNGYTAAFYPHSWGHSQGTQAHDPGLMQMDAKGTSAPPARDAVYAMPIPRGPLGEDHVITVEPGIYFASPALQKFANNPHFNWKLINELEGGIRIETDNWITSSTHEGNVNLTRRTLPKGTNVYDVDN